MMMAATCCVLFFLIMKRAKEILQLYKCQAICSSKTLFFKGLLITHTLSLSSKHYGQNQFIKGKVLSYYWCNEKNSEWIWFSTKISIQVPMCATIFPSILEVSSIFINAKIVISFYKISIFDFTKIVLGV